MEQSRRFLTRRTATGIGSLAAAILLQIGMFCPIVTVSPMVGQEHTVSWYSLFRMINDTASVIGGVDTIENGQWAITAAVVCLQAGIVMLAVSGISRLVAVKRPMRTLGVVGSVMTFAVMFFTAGGLYVKNTSLSLRFYCKSLDIEPMLYVSAAVALAAMVMCIWNEGCFNKKESAT